MYWYKGSKSSGFYDEINKTRSLRKGIRMSFASFLVFGFVGFIAYSVFSGLNYVSVVDQCYIRVKYDVINGDRKSIIEGIRRIKRDDYKTYRNLCWHVNTIYERQCILGKKDTPKVEPTGTDGCYIAGSKAIMISPVNSNDVTKVDRRVKQITKYVAVAKNYWNAN